MLTEFRMFYTLKGMKRRIFILRECAKILNNNVINESRWRSPYNLYMMRIKANELNEKANELHEYFYNR